MATIKDICRICLQETNYDEVTDVDVRKLESLRNKFSFLPKWDLETFRHHIICSTCIANFRTIKMVAKHVNKANTAIFSEMKKLNLKRINLKKMKRYSCFQENFIICRLCLEPTRHIAIYLYDNSKNILPMEYIEKMLKASKIYTNFDRTINPILCHQCWENIQISYSFRQQMELVMEKIYWYCALIRKTYISREELQNVLKLWGSLGVCKVENNLDVQTTKVHSEIQTKSKVKRKFKISNTKYYCSLNEHNYFKKQPCAISNNDFTKQTRTNTKKEKAKELLFAHNKNVSAEKNQGPALNIPVESDSTFVAQNENDENHKNNEDNDHSIEISSETPNLDGEVQVKKEIVEEELQIKREILSETESDDQFTEDGRGNEEINDSEIDDDDQCPNLESFIKNEPLDSDLYEMDMEMNEPPELELQGPCPSISSFTIHNTFTVDEKRSLINCAEQRGDVTNNITQNTPKANENNKPPDTPLLRVKRNLFNSDNLLQVRKEFVVSNAFQFKNLIVNVTKCDEQVKNIQEHSNKNVTKITKKKKGKAKISKHRSKLDESSKKEALKAETPSGHIFKCNLCDFTTTSSMASSRHAIGHKDNKLLMYPCNLCCYNTSSSERFMKHLKYVHPTQAENVHKLEIKKRVVKMESEKLRRVICEFCDKPLRKEIVCAKCARVLHRDCLRRTAKSMFFQCKHVQSFSKIKRQTTEMLTCPKSDSVNFYTGPSTSKEVKQELINARTDQF